ncbi:helix-turn-helix domain-containing protein [Maribellus maritimus]|uniref:helix-turn-helix domain-containing protein n=1 Tax=Maribellus maritimus TaxID=2870838 RepID=UPI001EE9BDC1|nr:helix-turn-helix domain-containing protein [Maribellus maritimus]MCG6189853.1 helix-turn-helix domain-containing protein [Maribellus maritimus]
MYIDQKYFDSWMQRLLSQVELLQKKVDRLGNKDNVINDEILLDNQDLCLLLKVSKRTLQRFRSSGKLPYKRIGKKTYYLESDVHKFLQSGFKSFVD